MISATRRKLNLCEINNESGEIRGDKLNEEEVASAQTVGGCGHTHAHTHTHTHTHTQYSQVR